MMPIYNKAQAVTKSDTVDFVGFGGKVLCDALHIGGAGTFTAVFEDDSVATFTAVAGDIIPLRVKRINNSGTATAMVALYMV